MRLLLILTFSLLFSATSEFDVKGMMCGVGCVNKIKANIEANKINYIDKPYTRFEGTEFEQNTFFIEDPNGNVLELKTFDQ